MILLLLGLCALPATARAEDARAILAKSIEAMGGKPKLEALSTLKLRIRTVRYRIDDSERAEGPYWLNIADGEEWRDLQGLRLASFQNDHSGQFAYETREVDDGHVMAAGTKWKSVWAWSARPSTRERLELAPERLLLTAEAASDLRKVEDADIFGVSHHVLQFSWQGFPATLYINPQSHLPQRLEVVSAWAHDSLTTMLGDVAWRTDYLLYRRSAGGLTYPWQQNQFRAGQAYRTLVISKLEENPAIAPDMFDIPDAARATLPMGARPYADRLIPAAAKGDVLQPIGRDIWLIEGSWNVLVARQSEGLVIVEGPQSSGYSTKILALLDERFPGVPVKAVVSTTDSLWHYAGLRTYIARGIPIYALGANMDVLRRFVARPRTLFPDALSRQPKDADFRPVTGPLILGSGASRITLYPIGGHGDARMMMVHFPASQLLYGSSNDILTDIGRPTFNMFELVRSVDALKIPVSSYVAIHTPRISWAEARRIAEMEPISVGL